MEVFGATCDAGPRRIMSHVSANPALCLWPQPSFMSGRFFNQAQFWHLASELRFRPDCHCLYTAQLWWFSIVFIRKKKSQSDSGDMTKIRRRPKSWPSSERRKLWYCRDWTRLHGWRWFGTRWM